ncbi:MAG: hypothetical protein JG775_209 [Defluviitaleaceae bacterium]|nr:hypothetical protein [Defluviitaleaceae bacterium]
MNSYYRNWPYSHMPNYKVQNPYPFYNTMATGYHENLYESSSDSFEEAMMRQRPQDINRIMALVNRQFENYYIELQSYGVPRIVTSNIFRSIVAYVLENENKYTGNLDQRTNALFNAYLRDNVIVFIILRGYGVPSNRINQMIRTIIRFVLENIGEQPATGWSEWEDLGGVLTSAPAVASWQPNRLDVFGRGQNNALWHKWWDGSRWSEWEDLGGILTSAPGAESWGRNRIDVFGRGQNNALWHKWWDGSRWSEWEDLGGGVITSGPGAASTASNRLEVFARGANNQLLFRTWNGITWSGWRSLGGEITSEPAAVSWGGNRLDVFARGLNNHLWHIWRL